MTTEVDLFEDEADRPAPDKEPAQKPSASPKAPKRKKRRSVMSDPVIQRMVIGAAAVIILWTAAMASSIIFGLANPPAPRTAAEHQLDLLAGVTADKPKSGQAWADYAKALITVKQYGTADKVIELGLERATEKSLILVQKARLARLRENDDEALKVAAQAIKAAEAEREADSKALSASGSRARLLPKGLEGALILTAEIQAERQQWEAAVKTWNEFLVLSPMDCVALVSRGDAQAKIGDKKGAEQSYRQALAYIPDMPEALAGLKAIGAEDK